MKVVLAGNPNAGKTTLFNALTHSNLRTGNFHGVTTSPAVCERGGITYVDVPGAYSFAAYSLEEKSALEEIVSADILVAVADALTLPQSLRFIKELILRNRNTAVYLTKVGLLRRRGGNVNVEKLSLCLGVPVFDCSPKELKKRLEKGLAFDVKRDSKMPFAEAYCGGNAKLSRADRLFSNNLFSVLFFVLAMTLTFFLAFHPSMPGARLKELTERLICEDLCGLITSKMQHVPTISLVRDGIFGGAGAVLSFLPQLIILYFILTFLDESGIASALSFTTDGLFEKVNLSGRAAFSLVSGFGCTAAAILTTRGFSSPAAQRRTVAVLPFIPCGAKLPVFLTFLSPLFKDPFPVVTCFYFAGVLISLAAARLIGGGGEGLLSEVAPIILPSPKTVAIKLCFYLKGFIIKVSGPVLVFCVLNWTLSHFSPAFVFSPPEESMLAWLAEIILPLFRPMGVTDWRIAYAALCGFIAKENVAASISMLCPEGPGLPLAPTMGVCAFMLLCPACVSAFSASVKEVGLKFTLKCFAVQLVSAFLGGYLLHFLFLL